MCLYKDVSKLGQVNIGVVPLHFWVKHIQYGKEYGSTSYFVEKAL